MSVSRIEIAAFVDSQLETATEVANVIQLSQESFTGNIKAAARSVNDFPQIRELPNGYAVKAWAAILFVDLRESTTRAELYGPRLTYQTMHTFLPTMAYIVEKYDGVVVGLRGDGLFAAFGLGKDGTNPANLDHSYCVGRASACAKAMIETVDEIISPKLSDMAKQEQHFRPPAIGCGIDAAEVVLTRIGYLSASEITAYGTCVNKAAKLSSESGAILIGNATRELFPTGKGGKVKFFPFPAKGAHKVVFPNDHAEVK